MERLVKPGASSAQLSENQQPDGVASDSIGLVVLIKRHNHRRFMARESFGRSDMANIAIIRYDSSMASLNISMPDELRDFVDRRTKETNHMTPTEYIRSLVREDQKRCEQERLERALFDGLASGDAVAADDLDALFEQKKKALLNRAKVIKAGRK